jgi:23S rRNA (adenine2030-N6)-methyltransferase
MLSYRHSFHAGNFADVLKHIVLVEILEYLNRKEKGFHYIDTHAGAGLYDLQSEHAAKLGEWEQGVGKLKREDWPELARYFAVIDYFNAAGSSSAYPGSPLIAQNLMREQDRATLFELHPTDFDLLKENTATDKRILVMQKDGFKGLLSQLPPPSRRGLVLIDPSYEVKTDYETVVSTLKQAHRKFATGIYALWYPVVDRQRIDEMEKQLMLSGIRDIQRYELGLHPDAEALGMTAAGIIVINPPWTLRDKMNQVLPKLASALGDSSEAFVRCDVLAEE